MKKKFDLSFCENIIAFDFFMVNFKKNKQKPLDYLYKINNNKYISLNIIRLAKELKQLIQLLRFFSKKKTNKKNSLFFLLENTKHFDLFKHYFSVNKINGWVDLFFR